MLMMLKDVDNVMSIDLFPTGRAWEKFRKCFRPVILIVRSNNTFHENKKRLFRAGDNRGTGVSLPRAIPQNVFGNLPAVAHPLGAKPSTEEMKEPCSLKLKLVVQIAVTEWTDYGLLRHATFYGMRDKKRSEAMRDF